MWKLVFDIWEKFGAVGLVIIILGSVAWFLRKDINNLLADHKQALADHREDRDQWLSDARADQKETREIVKCNTKIISSLHTIIDERIPKNTGG